MNESAEALAGNAGMDDALNIKIQLRRMKPSWPDLVANLFLACAGIGFSQFLAFSSADRRSLPGVAVFPLLFAFGWFVKFVDNLFLRFRLNRLLRD